MNNRDLQRILHIKEYCCKINRAIQRFGNDVDIFKNDQDYYQSVTMSLFQIGELSNGLSEKFKEDTKNDIPWSSVRAVRNMFAHEYNKISAEMIWKSLQTDIPKLQQFCENIIANAENDKT